MGRREELRVRLVDGIFGVESQAVGGFSGVKKSGLQRLTGRRIKLRAHEVKKKNSQHPARLHFKILMTAQALVQGNLRDLLLVIARISGNCRSRRVGA
ncbi:hypothetical protein MA16_Dca008041 [Dendrobium catenatum]|uniref:Uncharacterized protein n=1 Tax=Dendrobium catenatum TaxID=906689 RepID=A0A2I0WCU2_9ASPA|nr:hypothetical protein MA16_Dca008041 [Dendrobium catenatum]